MRPLTELLFYHLQNQRLDVVLPGLLERSLQRGWKVVVQSTAPDRVAALDAHLWTYRDDSFLPHGLAADRTASEYPVVLGLDEGRPNGANVRFLIDGAALPADAADYERLVLLFDGNDAEAEAAARMQWQEGKARGFAVTYWQQNAQGRWEQKA